VPAIARTLGVDALIEGSIVRSEERVRITVQLIDGPSDVHLWAQSYERPRGDVLVLQREVTRAIVDAIGVTLTGPEAERLARTDTVDPRAHEAYLQGRFFWNQRTESSLRQAIAWFERSIDLDRRYAPPHAGLADAYGLLPRYTRDHPRQALLQSKQHALNALERDPRLSEARTALAKMQYTLDYDWAAADESFRRAIDLDPGYATASHWYSVLLLILGRVEEAVAHARRAAELDPLSVTIKGHLAWVLYLANDSSGAAKVLAETLAMNPEHAPSYSLTGFMALQQSRHEDAVAAFTRAVELYKNDPRARSHLACGLALAGRRREAERILDALHEQAKTELVPLEAFVLATAVLRRHDDAFAWLDRSIDERSVSFYLFDLRLEPLYAGLRSDTRLSDLFRSIKLDLPIPQAGS
jgi:tetratricopeptide (TPR) repeat protein